MATNLAIEISKLIENQSDLFKKYDGAFDKLNQEAEKKVKEIDEIVEKKKKDFETFYIEKEKEFEKKVKEIPVDKIQADLSTIKTKAPIINIPDGVNENATIKGTYKIQEKGAEIFIYCDKGKIEIDKQKNTFTYTAPDITDGKNTTDTIYAYSARVGELKSDIVSKQITIFYVPIEYDEALNNTDFQSFEANSKNIEYV